jgi:valyl-tRNA synthetase
MVLEGKYKSQEQEATWQQYWEDQKTYAFDPKDTQREIYSIDTPPPTVSGEMHIGHFFSYAQQDFVARFQRMLGKNVFFPFGTDDNGLPTEKLVEKKKNVKSTKMQREDFIKLCIDYLKEIRPVFINDWKKMAHSADFSIFYSTIDDHSRKISQQSFIDLYKKGRQYRKEAPTLWCPTCQTAIAQAELEDKEHQSHFSDIIFKIEGKELVIATTRPEMLAATVAIFAHPDDKRYKELFGKKAIVPLYHHEVPILADKRADPEKGTGIVMCCTFGDQTDIEWYQAHNLALRKALTKDGKMTELTGKYAGMKIKDARRAILEDLQKAGLIKGQKEITHMVNVHERCHTEIEILHSRQWFIKYTDLKEEFLKRGDELNWYPAFMKTRLVNWINGIQWDWCVSRQRHYGIPFPVWYNKKTGEVILASEDQLPVDPLTDVPKGYTAEDVIPERDVMDTWATSALTPKLAVELMKGEPTYTKLYPMHLRPQAHDIITFWLFRTLAKAHMHDNTLPWKNAMISGFVLAEGGGKMSKSKGNFITPQEKMKAYPVDALRFWAAGSKLGADLQWQEKEAQTGKKIINKLWNASKFSIMHLEGYTPSSLDITKLTLLEQAMVSRLNRIIKECTDNFLKYEYSKTKLDAEKYFFITFCDNYLEIVKDRLYNTSREGKKSAQKVLYWALLQQLKLFAPIMPHITEAIYQGYFKQFEKKESIHTSLWPTYNKEYNNQRSEEVMNVVADIVAAVRKKKSEAKVSLKKRITNISISANITDEEYTMVKDDVLAVTNAEEIHFTSTKEATEIVVTL